MEKPHYTIKFEFSFYYTTYELWQGKKYIGFVDNNRRDNSWNKSEYLKDFLNGKR